MPACGLARPRAASGREHHGRQDDGKAHKDDDGPGRHQHSCRDQRARDAHGGADERSERQDDREAVGELAGRDRGHDEHGDHEDRPDGPESDDHRDDEEGRHPDLQRAYGKPERPREARIEQRRLERTEADGHERERRDGEHAMIVRSLSRRAAACPNR